MLFVSSRLPEVCDGKWGGEVWSAFVVSGVRPHAVFQCGFGHLAVVCHFGGGVPELLLPGLKKLSP